MPDTHSPKDWERIIQARPELLDLIRPRLNRYIPYQPTATQTAFLLTPQIEALYGGALAGGKANGIDCTVYTPFGPKRMGDIKVGDMVSNPDGSVATVIQVHPQGEQDLYRVTFIDGSSTLVTDNHLWFYHYSQRPLKARRHRINFAGDGLGEEVAGRVATTLMLKNFIDSADSRRGVNNPIIPLTKPVEFTMPVNRYSQATPVDPYVLGVLLGDGCLRNNSVSFASVDPEIIIEMGLRTGLEITTDKVKGLSHRFKAARDLIAILTSLEVYGHLANSKFVPKKYLLGSIATRKEVLCGLMDTDGYVDDRGHCEYTSVSEQLAKDVQYLVRSLGGKATINTKQGQYRDEDGNIVTCQLVYRVYIQSPNSAEFFKLPRKKARCRQSFNGGSSVLGNRMVSIEFEKRGEAQCITVDHPNSLYITDDFIVTHNSVALLMAALQYADVPGYSALLLRKSYKDLALPGALMDMSHKWLMDSDAKWNFNEMTWKFPSGATLTFGYLDRDADKYRYQGAAFQFIGFDELTQFAEESTYTYLFSRLRKNTALAVPLRLRAATNPGGLGGQWVYNRFFGKEVDRTRRTFVPAKITDNPYIETDQYLVALENLTEQDKAQLLDGNWDIMERGEYFRREWFKTREHLPELPWIRSWDLSAQTDTTRDSDYTVGALVALHNGQIFIKDLRRTRGSPHEIELFVRETAETDGRETHIYIEQEGGSSGVAVVHHYRDTVLKGFNVDGVKPVDNKQNRARVWSGYLQNGNVVIQQASWNEVFFSEAEAFPTKGVHDDQIDAISLGVSQLLEQPQPRLRFIDVYRRQRGNEVARAAYENRPQPAKTPPVQPNFSATPADQQKIQRIGLGAEPAPPLFKPRPLRRPDHSRWD